MQWFHVGCGIRASDRIKRHGRSSRISPLGFERTTWTHPLVRGLTERLPCQSRPSPVPLDPEGRHKRRPRAGRGTIRNATDCPVQRTAWLNDRTRYRPSPVLLDRRPAQAQAVRDTEQCRTRDATIKTVEHAGRGISGCAVRPS